MTYREPFRRTQSQAILLVSAVLFGAALGALGPSIVETFSSSASAAPAAPSARAKAAEAAFKDYEAAFQTGTATVEDVYTWSRRWFDAERSTNSSAGKNHLARMKALEADVQKKTAAGTASKRDSLAVAFYVAEATELAAAP